MLTRPADLTDVKIRSSLAPYGVSPTAHLCTSIRSYIELLLRWNRHISLTAVEDPLEIIHFHFGESVSAISIASIQGGRLADVGTGAGFPGIPLAMFAPHLQVTLIEANTRKAAFVAEVQRSLNLNNVRIFRGRFDDPATPLSKSDFIAARALGSYDELLDWSGGVLNPSGRVLLWLGLDHAGRISQNPAWQWEPPHRIPGTKKRVLLVGRASK